MKGQLDIELVNGKHVFTNRRFVPLKTGQESSSSEYGLYSSSNYVLPTNS